MKTGELATFAPTAPRSTPYDGAQPRERTPGLLGFLCFLIAVLSSYAVPRGPLKSNARGRHHAERHYSDHARKRTFDHRRLVVRRHDHHTALARSRKQLRLTLFLNARMTSLDMTDTVQAVRVAIKGEVPIHPTRRCTASRGSLNRVGTTGHALRPVGPAESLSKIHR
jgi:hypothetical protein